MQVNLRRLCLQLLVWLASEIVGGSLGLDDLADYSEYLMEHKTMATLDSEPLSVT